MHHALQSTLLTLLLSLTTSPAQTANTTPLPQGVIANWNIADAQHDTTATRERICLDTPEEWDDPYRFFRW